MSMTEREAGDKCPLGQNDCETCLKYQDDCDGKDVDEDDFESEMAYDRYRESWCEMLEEDLNKLFEKFVKHKGSIGYYQNAVDDAEEE